MHEKLGKIKTLIEDKDPPLSKDVVAVLEELADDVVRGEEGLHSTVASAIVFSGNDQHTKARLQDLVNERKRRAGE